MRHHRRHVVNMRSSVSQCSSNILELRHKCASSSQNAGTIDDLPAAKPRAPEALSHALDNPSRVTPAQQKFVAYDEASRWRPIHGSRPITGIIIFKDLQPGVHDAVLTWHATSQWHAAACVRQ